MGTVHPFISKARVLDPERTRIASEAFDRALQSLGETGDTLPSHRVRHLLASFIVERVMYDDAEPEQLAVEAVESLEIIEQARADAVTADLNEARSATGKLGRAYPGTR